MNRLLSSAMLMAAMLLSSGAGAQDKGQDNGSEAGVFARWLAPNSPECVPLKDIGSVSRVTRLTADQFQFVRALFIAIPPVSRTLPPGDSAVIARAEGKSMIALVAGEEVCARFLAPDFIQVMLNEVGEGKVGLIGTPI